MSEPAAASEALAKEAASWFVRMREPTVNDGERENFRRWLDRSPHHRSEYAHFQKLWTDLDQLAQPPAKKKRRGALAVAIACLALGFVAAAHVTVDAENATKIGELRQLRLADDSLVAMDADTRLRVEYSLWRRRVVLERGQAQFTVAPGWRPFEVIAGDGTMRDIGTTFNVREDGGKVSVSVQEGVVEISLPGVAQRVLLSGGQQADYRQGQILATATPGAGVAPAWRGNRWVFDDVQLGEVVREINRQHERPLRMLDPSLDGYRVSGVFDRSDRAGLLKALAIMLPIRAEEHREETRLLRR